MAENIPKKQLIIHLWACPRTLSTASMYSFAQRPDTVVIDEPLYASHISKCPQLSRPYRDQLLASYETDGNKVLESLPQKFQPGKNIIFCKQITKQLVGVNKELLYGENIHHLFLARDPLDIIASWSDRQEIHNEGCNLENLCFPQMVQLYSEIRQRTGTSPIIIDSNMLKTHAREVWTEVCAHIGIPFFDEQLSWPAGPKPDIDGLWAPYWYEQVHKSTGYGAGIDSVRQEQSPRMSLPALTGDKLEVYRECLPFAELLLSRAIGKDLLCPHTSRPDVPRSYHLPAVTSDAPKVQKPVLGDPRNQNTLAWIGDKLYPREQARVSAFDSSVQGGDAVWEGLRIYNYKIFKLDEHLDRLFHSAKAIAFENVPTRAFIKSAIFKTLQVNGMFDNTHIRLTLTRGVKITSSMNPHFNVFGTTLIVLPEWKPPVNPTTYDNDKGIPLITASGRRNPPQCLDSKIHHNNLLNNILPKIQANLAGAADALMLDVEGYVSETNATNVFMVSNGRLYTPHADSCLPGITRQTVIDIARSLGISIEEKRLSLTEFYVADEVFTTGTMGELTPVISIDGRVIGNEEAIKVPGSSKWPVLSRIQQSFRYLTETEALHKPMTAPRSPSESVISTSPPLSPVGLPKVSITFDINRIESNITFGDVVEKTIPDFFEVNKTGPQGDVPLPEGFANKIGFWKVYFFAIVIALFMGTLGECFLNIIDQTPLQWTNNNSFSNYADFYPYTGQLYWIAVTTGGGFVVGLIRWVTNFPDKVKTLYTDMQEGHVEFLPATLPLCMVSICCGATLGPELGLGNVGGGLATLVTEHVPFIRTLPEKDRKLLVLSGIAGALGGLFVSPMLSTLMVLELGKFSNAYMEAVMTLGSAAVVGFAVAYALIGVTWENYRGTWVELAVEWEFNLWNLGDAFVIGVFAAFFSFVFIVMLGASRQFFGRLRVFLSFSPFLKKVLPSTIGGLMIGVTNYSLPMTVGYGKLVNVPLVAAGIKQQLPQWLYIQSGFARIALLVISMTSGLVGGLGYPILTMGFIAGTVTHLKYPNLPPALCLSCWMAAAPLGLIPMPYTFVTLACLTFQLDPYQSSAVFVAALTSYLILSGSGISSTLEKQEKDHGSATAATAAITKAAINALTSIAISPDDCCNESTTKNRDYEPIESTSSNFGDRTLESLVEMSGSVGIGANDVDK